MTYICKVHPTKRYDSLNNAMSHLKNQHRDEIEGLSTSEASNKLLRER